LGDAREDTAAVLLWRVIYEINISLFWVMQGKIQQQYYLSIGLVFYSVGYA
jgi:hypothetical protein